MQEGGKDCRPAVSFVLICVNPASTFRVLLEARQVSGEPFRVLVKTFHFVLYVPVRHCVAAVLVSLNAVFDIVARVLG